MSTPPKPVATVEHDSAASREVRERIRTLALLACPAGKLIAPALLGCNSTPSR